MKIHRFKPNDASTSRRSGTATAAIGNQASVFPGEPAALGAATMEECRICREAKAPGACVSGVDGLCPTCRVLFQWFLDHYAEVEFRQEGWISPETTFQELSIESLDYVDWLLDAEEQFGVTISQRDGERMIAVADFLRHIKRHLSKKGHASNASNHDPLWDPGLDG